MDSAYRAQDDFFRFVNGEWICATEIPADKPTWGTIPMLREESEDALAGLLSELVQSDERTADEERIAALYRSYMDTASIASAGLQPIQDLLDTASSVSDEASLYRAIGKLARASGATFFGIGVSQDANSRADYCAMVGAGGITLPDRSFYLEDQPHYEAARSVLVDYANRLLKLAGVEAGYDPGKAILVFETSLAECMWPREMMREVARTYNPMSFDELQDSATSVQWSAFLEEFGFPSFDRVVVAQPDYLPKVVPALNSAAAAFAEDSAAGDAWEFYRNWLTFRVLHGYAPVLSEAYENLHFHEFSKPINGVSEMEPRLKRAVQTTCSSLSDLVGQLYGERYFSAEARERMDQLIENLLAAFKVSIPNLSWMSVGTQKRALNKLSRVRWKIGLPTKWRSYDDVELAANDLIGNLRKVGDADLAYSFAKLARKVDPEDWEMPPFMVNAYYHPLNNEIVFPAAILRPPLFDENADDAANYGAIGSIIGHELSHGFDDQGRRFNEEGNLDDWWTEADARKFEQRAKLLVSQFNKLKVLPGHKVNGRLTLGENIADLSGVTLSYRAYQHSLRGGPSPVVGGLSGEQRFFLAYAKAWQNKSRDEFAAMLVKTDVHSPAEFRVNAILTNLPEFHDAFDVVQGDKMYTAPEDRIRIW